MRQTKPCHSPSRLSHITSCISITHSARVGYLHRAPRPQHRPPPSLSGPEAQDPSGSLALPHLSSPRQPGNSRLTSANGSDEHLLPPRFACLRPSSPPNMKHPMPVLSRGDVMISSLAVLDRPSRGCRWSSAPAPPHLPRVSSNAIQSRRPGLLFLPHGHSEVPRGAPPPTTSAKPWNKPRPVARGPSLWRYPRVQGTSRVQLRVFASPFSPSTALPATRGETQWPCRLAWVFVSPCSRPPTGTLAPLLEPW